MFKRRRKLFLALTLSSLFMTIAASVAARAESARPSKVLVISDVDDTIKISYVRNKFEMISFSAFSDSLFYGMNQLYQNVERQTNAKFFYVSNGWTPTIEEVHERLIHNFEFPEGEYLSRDNPFNKDFKFEAISKVIEKENPTLVIMIGDNGERDPISYHRVQKKFADKNIEFRTYIHKVYDRPTVEVAESSHSKAGLFPEQIEYLNAAELSQLLMEAGLTTAKDNFQLVKNIRDTIYEQKPNSVYGPLVSPYYQSIKPVTVSCSRLYNATVAVDIMLEQIRQKMIEVSPKGGN